MSIVRLLLALSLSLALLSPCGEAGAHGQDDYQRRVWTQQEGAPPDIGKLAQTSDGWLWLGTSDGVFRFDGVSFEQYTPPGHPALANRQVTDMHATDNGDLYISYFPLPVAVVRRDGRYEVLPPTADTRRMTPLAMLVDRDGALWTIGDGIRRFADGRWTTVENDATWAAFGHYDLLLDQDGRLWASSPTGTWRLDRTRGRFHEVSSLAGGLTEEPNGDVWLLGLDGGRAVRLARASRGKGQLAHDNAITSRFAGQFASNGVLWTLGCAAPPCLVDEEASSVDGALPREGAGPAGVGRGSAAGRQRLAILEDRESNMWVASNDGLIRFRPKRFIVTGMDLSDDLYSIASDRSGEVWVAHTVEGKRWRLAPDGTPVPQPGQPSYQLARGRDGNLLMAGKQHILRVSEAAVETIPLPSGQDGKPRIHRSMGLLDDGKLLWSESLDAGSIAWNGRGWVTSAELGLPKGVYLRQAGDLGQQWLALTNGELVLYDDTRLTRYDATLVNVVTGIFPGHPLVVAGTSGVAVLKHGKLHLLHSSNPNALRSVSGLAVTANGDRWLNGVAGVVHVRAADWKRAVDRPDLPLRHELFGVTDGYPGRASLLSRQNTAITGDGRHVWFHSTNGIVGLDSEHVRRNTVSPQPIVQQVTTDTGRFDAGKSLRLPPGSDSFRLHFTAPMLRQPEHTRFEYRLDGVDTDWRDAGTLRTTSYTNIAPGAYVFRLRAINEDGVYSKEDTVLQLSVAPTFVQSMPFQVAVSIMVAALLYTLYRLRVFYLTSRLAERYRIKLSERERIARTLHDTFLQTIQALLLRLGTLERNLPDDGRARQQLQTMLDDVERVIEEGRDQVQALRAPQARMFEEVIQTCIDELRILHPEIEFALHSEGAARVLVGEVIEEMGQIACEALRNASAHARASRIVASVRYGRRECVLTVQDDGSGLDPDVAALGFRTGHWGLIGMRERASRIGGRLRIEGTANGGTTVSVSLSGASAYLRRAA
ncbi:histidine kinase [Massilia sp. CFBP9012]|uniref:sensor histidine kinase n=1 Tax=Massilia sp. CFBP9012 TaxID=3096531 RepID=UPI002A69CA49|nr:triple tyrosine motif-containing protein [Massilia sp. CFBP9012]MDY0975908.1 histidine kinase [Massilia sp. CFBP9012]